MGWTNFSLLPEAGQLSEKAIEIARLLVSHLAW